MAQKQELVVGKKKGEVTVGEEVRAYLEPLKIFDKGLEQRVFYLLEPFFEKFRSGQYDLLNREKQVVRKLQEMQDAISCAIDIRVNGICRVSASGNFPKPAWMSDKVHADSIIRSLATAPVPQSDKSSGLSAFKKLSWVSKMSRLLHDPHGRKVGERAHWLAEMLLQCVNHDHGKDLGLGGPRIVTMSIPDDSGYGQMNIESGDRLGNLLYFTFRHLFNNLLQCAMLAEVEMFDRIEPLIRLLDAAIPLGEKVDQPGVWLVLTS